MQVGPADPHEGNPYTYLAHARLRQRAFLDVEDMGTVENEHLHDGNQAALLVMWTSGLRCPQSEMAP
jgi:hypothetical protein